MWSTDKNLYQERIGFSCSLYTVIVEKGENVQQKPRKI